MINSMSNLGAAPYANAIKGKYFDVSLERTDGKVCTGETLTDETLKGKANNIDFTLEKNLTDGLIFQTKNGIVSINGEGKITNCMTKNKDDKTVTWRPLDVVA